MSFGSPADIGGIPRHKIELLLNRTGVPGAALQIFRTMCIRINDDLAIELGGQLPKK